MPVKLNMDRILKDLRTINNDSLDLCEEISLLTYLAKLTEDEILTNEIEAASNILHCAFKNLHENHYDLIENILEQNTFMLTDRLSGNSFKIFIRNTWLFRIILLNSIKHRDISNCLNHTNFFNSVIKHILKNIVLVKPLSIHLLRTLLFIVTKPKNILTSNVSVMILCKMNEVALSPITAFRQYARGISKAVAPFLSEKETILFNVSLLPVKSMDMCDIVKCFPESYIRKNRIFIVKKVLEMFQKNVESKDGGILYQSFLFYSFAEWKTEIWPLFTSHMRYIDYEGEFFQSLLKYWITSNINSYKTEFYNFCRKEAMDWKVKGYILLESKKKGCTIDENIIKEDTLLLSNNIETRGLALKIASTYHKKSLWPKNYEIDIVVNYLYSNTNLTLEEEEVRSFRLFFSQIFLHAHNELKKNCESLSNYLSVMEKVYKYCSATLKTDFFDIGAEIVYILWSIATGGSKNLQLNYRLEKKDCYSESENLLFQKLKENNAWLFETENFQLELVNCFHKNNSSSTYLSKLFKYLNVNLNNIDLKLVVNESVVQPGLDGEKRIKNYSEIIFHGQHNSQFLEDIYNFLVNLDISDKICYSEDVIFRTVLYLEIVVTAAKYNKYDKQNLHKIVEQCLCVIENVIINRNSSDNHNYKTTKTIEAFMNSIMLCLIEHVDILWITIDKAKVIKQLILIIQRSNMKRPLSLAVEVLKRFGSKMNENESDVNYKTHFLNDTLNSLYQTTTKSDLKIRRNPESRLVIHAMCCSDESLNKPLLKWVMAHLLHVISDPNASDSTLASALHSTEILISDNSLQVPTLPYISDLIIQCVELFSRRSWIVRNADLQVTRAIIDRFYGVCLDVCNRPKSVVDLLVLFPNLTSYFYGILSSDKLDERAVLVFQFFLESQIKQHLFTLQISKERFLPLFVDILQKYPNHLGKMAARSYCALCLESDIPKSICSFVYFCKCNFGFLSMNVYANFLFLIQLLYEKFKKSFHYLINKDEIKVVNLAVNDLLEHLGKYDTEYFNFILIKVKPRTEILDEFLINLEEEDFQKRLWLHSHVPFVLINAKPKEIGKVLRTVLCNKLLSCIQIKILTILISKFESKVLDRQTCGEILETLFQNSLCLEDTDHYLLNCYFETILTFYEHESDLHFEINLPQIQNLHSFYKILILILYFSRQTDQLELIDKQYFYNLVDKTYMRFHSVSDEMKNDIISTLAYSQKGAPVEFKLKIFKMIFYTSLFTSTHLEAYKCISLIMMKKYSGILTALKDFFSVQNLSMQLKSEMVVNQFFDDILNYLPEHFKEVQSDGYYSEESDILVPKLFLQRFLNKEMPNT